MKKTTKIILSSALTMALCASVIAGSTFALFSSKDEVNVAITAGNVAVTASVDQNSLKGYSANWSGSTYEEQNVESGTFTTGGTFSYDSAQSTLTLSNIAPGDGVEFNLKITNSSTIKIKYRLEVTATDGVDNELYKALDVTFGGNKATLNSATAYVQETWANLDASANPDPVKVKIMLPITIGEQNQYQGKTCTLKVSVYAIQANAHVD